MKHFLHISLALFAFAISSFAAATPGHDHGSWTSGLFHALWVLPLVGVAYFAIKNVSKITKGDK